MKLESIKISNFKIFKNAEMKEIPDLCVVVGANGVGKSTLFDVFRFLKDALTYNIDRALQVRGGFKEVISRGSKATDQIEIEIQYRMTITDYERLVTYRLEIGNDDTGKPVIKREILRYKRGSHGSPYHFLDFSEGKGYAIINEEDFKKADTDLTRENQFLESPQTLAIKGLGQFKKFKAANAFRQIIENWQISDFHINSARGSKDITGDNEHLSATGDNLQLVAQKLYNHYPEIFEKILHKMQRRIPGIGAISTEETPDGRVLLKFKDGSFQDPFVDRYVSDGTIKMFAYMVLLNDPTPYQFLCIEEPENQLYPRLLWELAEEFRDYAQRGQGGQVFVSTHSPDFLNAARLGEVFWLEKENGYSTIKRASMDNQITAYMNDDDQMGWLWQQGFFGKADPR